MAKLRHELPSDVLAEKALVGCLILDGTCYDEIVPHGLSKDDFFNSQCGIIYEAITSLHLKKAPIDYLTVSNKLADSGNIELLGDDLHKGTDYLLHLVDDQASSAHVSYYAQLVKEKAVLRKAIRLCKHMIGKGQSFDGEVSDFVADFEKEVFALSQTMRSKTSKTESIKTYLIESIQEINKMESKKAGEINGVPTGFNALDSKLLGMLPGQLFIVAGRPGMGKTAFGTTVALQATKKTNLPVAIFSLEMMAKELVTRLLCTESRTDYGKLRKKVYDKEDISRMILGAQKLSELNIFVNDFGTLTVLDIQAECRRIKSEYGLGLVVVDYVQLLRSHSGNPSREQQISEISRSLKQLAKEMECPVIALAQLNRGVENRDNKRPNVSDLRESGSLEQDADVVILLYRDDFYNKESQEPGVAEVIIGKNRAGETGTVKLKWLGQYTTFADLQYPPNEN